MVKLRLSSEAAVVFQRECNLAAISGWRTRYQESGLIVHGAKNRSAVMPAPASSLMRAVRLVWFGFI